MIDLNLIIDCIYINVIFLLIENSNKILEREIILLVNWKVNGL